MIPNILGNIGDITRSILFPEKVIIEFIRELESKCNMLVQNFTKIELTPDDVAEAVVEYVKKNKGVTLTKNEISFLIKKETDNTDMFRPLIETYKFDGCMATTYTH